MSADQAALERDILSNLQKQYKEGSLNLSNVSSKSQKLMQLAGGFIYLKDNDERSAKRITHNPKLELLKECLEDIRGKILLFHNYEEEAHIIEEFCDQKKVKFRAIRGAIKNKDQNFEDFESDPSIKLMIAHPKSAKESLDFSFCQTIIFYSQNISRLEVTQCKGRISRHGQKKPMLFIHFICENSVDEVRYDRRDDIDTMAEGVFDYIMGKI